MVEEKATFLSKYFTLTIILLPILNMYFCIGSLTFADIFLFVFLFFQLFVFLTKKEHGKTVTIGYIELLPYILIIFIWLIISLLENNMDVFFRTARYFLYFVFLLFYVRKYFNVRFGITLYSKVAFLSTIYMFIQLFFRRVFGIYLLNYLPFLKLTSKGIAEIIPSRVKSIFSEPAMYSIYVIFILCILLYEKQKNKFHWIEIGVLSVGVVLSASTTGLVALGLVYFLFIISFMKTKKRIKKSKVTVGIIALFLGLFLGSVIIEQSGMLDYAIYRIQEGTSYDNRMNSFSLIEQFDNKVFGNGMNPEMNIWGDYLSGFPRLILYFGYTGVIIFGIMSLSQFRKAKGRERSILLLFIFLNIGTEILLGPIVLIPYAFILKMRTNRIRLYNE